MSDGTIITDHAAYQQLIVDRDRYKQALEAMLPGMLGSEHEMMTNAAYHACVCIARGALGLARDPASESESA